jgi:autophagy-related protein 2
MTAIDFAEPETRTHHEFRIIFSSCPIRCHLTESFILFLKDLSLALIQNGDVPSSSSPSSPAYFQLMMVSRIDLKIDYHASSVNVKALHEGDYLQLLNIFPLDGLELSLQPIRLKGLNGTSTVLNSLLELWITDIYKNQLHKVITGTTPFKGISNIGQGLTGLVYMPVTEYRRKNRLAWKQITKGTTSLVKTIVGETLNVSHHVSLFLANAITDLANAGGEMKRIDQEEEGNRKKFSQPRNVSQGLEKAIQSVSREFSTAAETVIAVPIREFHRNGVTGVVSSVVQALPIAVLRPIAGIAEGFSYTALGLRNSLNPVHVADEQDLWNIEEL